jgi:predicted Rossmann-fold nucleotide-binding protein
MQGFNLPYQPIPQKLYTSADLFRGFEPSDPSSWTRTADFEIYRHFVVEGRTTPHNPYTGMMQALHDNAISEATSTYIEGRRVAAIIGDHALARDSETYRTAAILARRLTRSGILVCTGGGPGAMEAGHLGAALANSSDTDLDHALARLKQQPVVPSLAKIVDANGVVDGSLAAQAFAWFRPSFELAASIKAPAESLAIPTWGYGHEPPTPFATHIAKYFQNSVREDGLLAIARQGIICMQGQAGTIQEIFQDAALNYYRTSGGVSPMVVFGTDYWTRSFPVVGVLKSLFGPEFARSLLVTDDVDAAAAFIEKFSG